MPLNPCPSTHVPQSLARLRNLTRISTTSIGLVLAAVALASCVQRPAPPAAGPAAAVPPPPPASSQVRPGPAVAPAVAPQGRAQWVKPDGASADYRADLEACFGFARARIAHDERIEADTHAAFDAAPGGFGVSELSDRMGAFERKNRRASLYRECMRDKGYVEQK